MTAPTKLPIQIIGPTVLRRARAEYQATWQREWPHSNSYLAQLVVDAKQALGLPVTAKARAAEVRQETLTLMRLDHEF